MPDLLTLDEARALTERAARADWRPDLGTLHVAEGAYIYGSEWRMIVGAREAIVDGDQDFAIMDAPVFMVDRSTGHVRVLPWHDDPLLTASGPVPPLTPAPQRP